jgi:Transposase DDE domain group 1
MIWTCCVRVGCRSCSTGSTHPPPSGRCCGSSASGTPGSWSRCSARTCARWPHAPRCWPGSTSRRSSTLSDLDSLLRPVYGHAKQGASYGHTKIAGKQVLRTGLSPLATTISTTRCAPVIAGMRLRAGKTGSGKGAGRMVAHAIVTARAAGATGKILVRGDSAYGNRAVIRACRRGKAEFSLDMTNNPAIARACGCQKIVACQATC